MLRKLSSMGRLFFTLLGFTLAGLMGASCSSRSDCSCDDVTIAKFPEPIDVSSSEITFEVEWKGGRSTCVAGATETECSLAEAGSRFVDVVYEWESKDVDAGEDGVAQVVRRLPVVLGVSVEGLHEELQVKFSERTLSAGKTWKDTDERACGSSCNNRQLALVADK